LSNRQTDQVRDAVLTLDREHEVRRHIDRICQAVPQ
jgi:hypothetical protein